MISGEKGHVITKIVKHAVNSIIFDIVKHNKNSWQTLSGIKYTKKTTDVLRHREMFMTSAR